MNSETEGGGGMRCFTPGQTVQRRDMWHDQVWSTQALRVIDDSATALVTAMWPGAEVRVPDSYARSRRSAHMAERGDVIRQLAAGTWTLTDTCWQDTVLVLWRPPHTYFSVNAFYTVDGGDGGTRLRNWYINFERPSVRRGQGFDTFDLFVDLVVDADLSTWNWKDEAEYAQARRLGIVDDSEHAQVDAARDQALAWVTERRGPFAEAGWWAAWRRDSTWPTPTFARIAR
ncbi:DUF402 domain-containing protein [Streptomyces sp. NPDC096311]|uniref:DUF402 domain-containing protein n=1 Tax=Streptomyces sp. NPDC096311 TaxID=3366083 RepID=UPI00382783B3